VKVAVVGKGGSGKTTTAGIIARTLGRAGHRVIALDCDANPNLGIALGLGPAETERLQGIREGLDQDETQHAPTVSEMLQRFGAQAPDAVRLAVVTKIDKPDPG
jgi:CO dehydrogenase maturation factor